MDISSAVADFTRIRNLAPFERMAYTVQELGDAVGTGEGIADSTTSCCREIQTGFAPVHPLRIPEYTTPPLRPFL